MRAFQSGTGGVQDGFLFPHLRPLIDSQLDRLCYVTPDNSNMPEDSFSTVEDDDKRAGMAWHCILSNTAQSAQRSCDSRLGVSPYAGQCLVKTTRRLSVPGFMQVQKKTRDPAGTRLKLNFSLNRRPSRSHGRSVGLLLSRFLLSNEQS